MSNMKLFFSKKDEVYYYLAEDDLPTCDVCGKEIINNLVYHSIWAGKGVVKRSGGNFRCEIKTYHINCFDKIYTRGDTDEFKICIVTDKVPQTALPIFERSPSFVNSKGLNTFQVNKIITNSEAEVLDRTIVSNDPNQSKMVDYDHNLLEYEKRDEELGGSVFLLNDINRDQKLQLESNQKKVDKNDSVEDLKKAAKKTASKKKTVQKKIKRELVYPEVPQLKTIDLEYLNLLKDSTPILPEQEEVKKIEKK